MPDGLLAVVLKLTDLAAQVERVEQSAERRFEDLAAACAKALAQVSAAREEAGTLGGRAGELEQKIADIGALLAQMSARLRELADDGTPAKGTADRYRVNPAPPWWQPGHERCAETVSRLRDWVEEVYRPGFGYLGARLGDCWDRHPLCVAYLDTLHEAWCLLYIPSRDPKMVFAQLDWLTRPLLQAAEVMAAETSPCLRLGHRKPGPDPAYVAPAWPNGHR
jgi:hypothetical protein